MHKRKLPNGFTFDLHTIFQAFNLVDHGESVDVSGQGTIRCPSPDHTDKKPSCVVFPDGWVHCHGCKYSAFIDKAISQYDANVKKSHTPFSAESVWIQICNMFPELQQYSYIPLNDSLLLEGREHWNLYQDSIWEKVLNPRGIYNYDIDFGCNKSGTVLEIPVYDKLGNLINIRYYRPNPDKGQKKFWNHRDAVFPAFPYPISQLNNVEDQDTLIITGGELKAIACIEACEREGLTSVKAISFTSGESHVPGELLKTVCLNNWAYIHICYDIDEAGVKGAKILQQHLLDQIAYDRKETAVGIINLPLDKAKYPTGDVNDYLADRGLLGGLLPDAMRTAETPSDIMANEVRAYDLSKSIKTSVTEWVENTINPSTVYSIDGLVSETAQEPRIKIPYKFKIKCRRDQRDCAKCPRFTCDSQTVFQIDIVGDYVLTHDEKFADKAVLQRVGVPETCKGCKIDKEDNSFEQRSISEFAITSPSVGNNNQRHTIRCVQFHEEGQSLSPGGRYRFQGAVTGSSHALFHVIKNQHYYQEVLNSIDYEQIKERAQPVTITPSAIKYKLELLADDISKLIGIVQRQRTVLYTDLVYHSAAEVTNQRGKPELGALQMLIVGDSGTGKSSIMSSLASYYDKGEIVDCANSTYAGLAAGVSPDSKASIRWGALVTNDKGLVVLEELAELNKGKENADILNALKQVRSSGKMQINKIAKGVANARCRIIAVSNASQEISRFNRGWEALCDVSPDPASLRRFGFVQVLKSLDAPLDPFPILPERINQETDRQLVVWAWTREPQHIIIPRETYLQLSTHSRYLQEEYGSAQISPIGNFIGETLKKIAVAVAIRTFSSTDNIHVNVHPAHVDVAFQLLEDMYSDPDLGISQMLLKAEVNRKIRRLESRLEAHPSTGALIWRLAIGNQRSESDRDLFSDSDWLVANRIASWNRQKLVLDEAIRTAVLDKQIELPNLQEDDFDRTNRGEI